VIDLCQIFEKCIKDDFRGNAAASARRKAQVEEKMSCLESFQIRVSSTKPKKEDYYDFTLIVSSFTFLHMTQDSVE
jgi:hypothetical protein